MAVTSIWKVEGRLARVLGYAGNPDKAEGSPDEWELQGVGAAILYAADPGKTERQLYVTGVNCLPATALEEMNATKRQYGKTGGIVAFHGYQAFAPGETDPATAHEVGVALAQELWGGRFEVVVATHLDKAHLHNHFVVNSVSFADGRRFHRDAACYRAMREASDELCREHGLSVVESPGRGGARHHAEWRAEREGRPTWRSLVKADVDEAVGRAASMRQFHANLRAMGYDVKVGKDISVRPPGKERFVRLRRNFGDAYSQEGIGARILANSRQRLPSAGRGRSQGAPARAEGHAREPVPQVHGAAQRREEAEGARRAGAFPAARGSARTRSHIGELALLAREGIETRSQLAAYERALADKSEALQAERRALRNEARRSKAAGSPRPKPPHRRDSVGAAGRKARGARLRAHPGKKRRAAGRIAQIEGAEANREERQVEGHGRIERGC
ncbi:MAG: relaxase/mobilization nuclease domain-containing protein [Eggerthella lenta]